MSDADLNKDLPQSEVEIVQSKEVWSEYQLKDGTTLRIKPVVAAALRVEGQYTADGDPVYAVKASLVTDVRAPSALKKRS